MHPHPSPTPPIHPPPSPALSASLARSLEVVLLLGGREAGARHLPLDAVISVGPEPTDTFSIPDLDASVGVVRVTPSGSAGEAGAGAATRVLVMAAVRGGRLERDGAGVADLGTLWRPDGLLPLQDLDRLWVELSAGPVALRLSPSPLLPEAPWPTGRFRPQIFDAGDRGWLASLAAWSAVTAAVVWALWGLEPVEGVELADLPDRVVSILRLPDADALPASSGGGGPASPPPSVVVPLPRVQPESDGGGLSWGRQALEAHSALLRRIAETGEPLLLPTGPDGRSSEEILAALETLRLSTPGQVLDTGPGGTRGPVGQGGQGDARLEGGLRTGTVGEVVLVSVASSVPSPEAVAALWREEVAALQQAAAPQRGPPSEAIRGAVSTYKQQLRGCFERRLRERPSLSGRITLAVDISAGAVVAVTVLEDTLRDAELSRCMVLRARAWRFSAEITEQIALPFSFSGG